MNIFTETINGVLVTYTRTKNRNFLDTDCFFEGYWRARTFKELIALNSKTGKTRKFSEVSTLPNFL